MTENERELLHRVVNHLIAGTPPTHTSKLRMAELLQDIRDEDIKARSERPIVPEFNGSKADRVAPPVDGCGELGQGTEGREDPAWVTTIVRQNYEKTVEIARLNRKIEDLEVLAMTRQSQLLTASGEREHYRRQVGDVRRDLAAANETIAELQSKVTLNKTNTVFHGLASERIKQLERQVSELKRLVRVAHAEGWKARSSKLGRDASLAAECTEWLESAVRQRRGAIDKL